VVAYLRSEAPVAHAVPRVAWSAVAGSVLPLLHLEPRAIEGPRGAPANPEPSVARGEYLAEHVCRCVGCHTKLDPATAQPIGAKAAGSLPLPSQGPDLGKVFVAPNLTSDPQSGVTGKLGEDQFVARMQAGRTHASSSMPWESFATNTTESDLRSIYRYLRTLPAVYADVGATYRDRGGRADP